MKKRYVKLLALALSAAVSITALPVTGFAAQTGLAEETIELYDGEGEGSGDQEGDTEEQAKTVTVAAPEKVEVTKGTTVDAVKEKLAEWEAEVTVTGVEGAEVKAFLELNESDVTEDALKEVKVIEDAIKVTLKQKQTTEAQDDEEDDTSDEENWEEITVTDGKATIDKTEYTVEGKLTINIDVQLPKLTVTAPEKVQVDKGTTVAALKEKVAGTSATTDVEGVAAALELEEDKIEEGALNTAGTIDDAVKVVLKDAEGTVLEVSEEGTIKIKKAVSEPETQEDEEESETPEDPQTEEEEYTVVLPNVAVEVVEPSTTPDPGTTTPDPGTTTPDPGTTTPDPGTTTPNPGTTTPETPAKVEVSKVTATYNGTSVNGKTLTIKKGSKYTFKASAAPSNAADKKITWSTSNKKVATVTSKGVVKGVKAGTATITAKTSNGKKATFKVKVQNKDVKVSKVAITAKTKTVKKGKKVTLTAAVTPATAKNTKVTWKSSNKKIATVSSKGVVKGVKKGTVKITATAKDGSKKKATITIKVK